MNTPNSMPRRVKPVEVITDTRDACWDERCDCTQEVSRVRLRQPRKPRPIRNSQMADQLKQKGFSK